MMSLQETTASGFDITPRTGPAKFFASDPATFQSGKERRMQPRYPSRGKAIIRSISPLMECRARANVIDISANGIKLRTAFQGLFPGSMLHIFLKKVLLIGEVRYCIPAGRDVELGIRLEHTDTMEA